jgi:glutathione S-transferase
MSAPLTLYHFDSCPYCLRVRRALADLGVEAELKNVHTDPHAQEELYRAMERGTVPVLRIHDEDRWLPESGDIVTFLYARFGNGRTPPLSARVNPQLLIAGLAVLVFVLLALR